MTLDKFFSKRIQKPEEEKPDALERDGELITETIKREPEKKIEKPDKKEETPAPEPEDVIEGILLDVGYDGKQGKAYGWIYETNTQKLRKWYDTSGHLPYLLSDLREEEIRARHEGVLKHRGFVNLKTIKKFDLIKDQAVTMSKVVAKDPLSIGGRGDSIRNLLQGHSWEDYIQYHKCYAYDKQIVMGMPYRISGGKISPITPEISQDVRKQITKLFESEKEDYILALDQFLGYFFCPIPDIKRVAFDIEVFSPVDRIPDAGRADERIISVTFAGNDGLKRILMLQRDDVEEGSKIPECDAELEIFEREKDLLSEVFRIFESYPLVLSYNGDNFDLKYIYNRAIKHLGFFPDQVPIYMTSTPQSEVGHLKENIHVDLYKFFHNRAIKISAFKNIYPDVSLNTVSQTFLDAGKVCLDKPISELCLQELGYYCLRDSQLTLDLTTFNNNLVMNLIFLLMRITRLSMEDLTRQGVSAWLRNLFYAEHRARAFIIPTQDYIKRYKGGASTKAMIKGKKYQGAIVVQPQPGVHFNVVVLDFASLYPSIIKQWNLSYETVNCPHPECKNDEDYRIPGTPYWRCSRKVGIMALVIGLLRDLRVKYFKDKAKDKSLSKAEKQMYNIITQSLKIIINASYGVFGSEAFPLFCLPVADATTAIGRYAITQTQEECARMGVEVIYGDTDSVFLKNPAQELIAKLIEWSEKELQIELDVEKTYRYLALSDRKKNYFGVYKDGNVDIKGLTGKKRHVPPFIQNAFLEMIEELRKVQVESDFETAKQGIRSKLKGFIKKLENREFAVEELAFQMTLSKDLNQYSKTMPQHVRAARLLAERTKKDLSSGDIIRFVKTRGAEGVLPVELAKVTDISIKVYKQQLESTFEQVLDAMGIPFEELYGIKVRKLDAFI
ncbi:MAG: DNA-directed DNA polymerase I [Promethearchaeota archaeon]|nr:MAG: DNA-directed DNA polymerase I [Candidatus Lokiarchaeota archaeon]